MGGEFFDSGAFREIIFNRFLLGLAGGLPIDDN